MSACWIIGREAQLASDGHKYITEPFIVFDTENDAEAACDMIERVSGERPRTVEGSRYHVSAAQTR